MNKQPNNLSSWINSLSIANNPHKEGCTSPTPRHPPTTSRGQNYSQVIDYKDSPRLPDYPRPFLEGGGTDAARPGCGQDKFSTGFLVGDDLQFWMMAVDEAASFFGCDDNDRAMLQQHLADQGWCFVLPLRDLLAANDLPICQRAEFKRVA